MPEHLPEDMPGRMPEDMPDRMPENMSDRMPEDLPVTKCINVMVGITRSKVCFSFFLAKIAWNHVFWNMFSRETSVVSHTIAFQAILAKKKRKKNSAG